MTARTHGPRFSSGAGDLACLEAGGADVETLRGLADLGVHGLDVRVPAARGAAVGVGHGHAEARTLAADVAHRGHEKLPEIRSNGLAGEPRAGSSPVDRFQHYRTRSRRQRRRSARMSRMAGKARLLTSADPRLELLEVVLGGATAKNLATLGLTTVGELLEHVRRRYAKRGELTDLSYLVPGEIATIWARVEKIESKYLRQSKLHKLDVRVTDGNGKMDITFFSKRPMRWGLEVGQA